MARTVHVRVAGEVSDLPHLERALLPIAPRIVSARLTRTGLHVVLSTELSSPYHDVLSVGDGACLELVLKRVLERVVATHEAPDRQPEWLRLFPPGIDATRAGILWESTALIERGL